MTQEQFKIFTDKTLDAVSRYTKLYTNKESSGKFILIYGPDKIIYNERSEIIELLTSKIFIEPDKIYPCVDIQIININDAGDISIKFQIAGFAPRPFQNNYFGNPGPYVFMISSQIINPEVNTESTELRKKLSEAIKIEIDNI